VIDEKKGRKEGRIKEGKRKRKKKRERKRKKGNKEASVLLELCERKLKFTRPNFMRGVCSVVSETKYVNGSGRHYLITAALDWTRT
jgi:hypothetical protein